eukprot:12425782-Karenia_brevis.AAC.1
MGNALLLALVSVIGARPTPAHQPTNSHHVTMDLGKQMLHMVGVIMVIWLLLLEVWIVSGLL